MILVRTVCQGLTFIASTVFKGMGAWGYFKDFEEHLITVYEIAYHYMASFCNGQGDILVMMASDKVPYSRRI